MTQKIKEKRNRIMKTRRIITFTLLIIVFFLFAIYNVLKSDFFNLKTIDIIGNNHVIQEEIVEISGLIYNRNIFQFNLEEIKTNVEKHSYIEDAEIKIKLPNRLLITINEREKYAIIPYMGIYVYIDSNLNVLEVSEEYLYDNLILVTGTKIDSISVGEKLQASDYSQLEYILSIIEASRYASINHMMSEINVNEDESVSIITVNGIEVLLNIDSDPAYMTVALKEVLARFTDDDRNLILDMRFEGGFSVREKTN